MSLTYSTYVDQLANLMVIEATDPNFVTFLPGCIDYAEQRIYRELDLLYTQVTDSGLTTFNQVREFTLPTFQGIFITLDAINIIVPAGSAATAGTRVPLIPVDLSFINAVYPSNVSATDVPAYFAMYSNSVVILGPTPDDEYTVEVTGTQRPEALSATNTTTILTDYIPDVFMAASMVFASGYMRDFGAQADNPQMGASWEAQYKTLVQSAAVEQAMAKFQSEGWTSQSPSPTATPKRV